MRRITFKVGVRVFCAWLYALNPAGSELSPQKTLVLGRTN